jgi:hypothetical protein
MLGPLAESAPALSGLRRSILAILVFGLVGTGSELLLLHHYEDAWQSTPLALTALALAVILWHAAQRGAASVQALRVTMVLVAMSGLVGLALHYRSNYEFQTELDPELAGLSLFWKVMQRKAPPSLAPGTMTQLGLLGLAYTFRHPALACNPGKGA